MKNLSHGFLTVTISTLVIFSYIQGVVVPETEARYAKQGAAVATFSRYPDTVTAKGTLPCNPQLVKCGAIRVRKDTVPDNYQDFTFTHNIPGYASFVLDDDATLSNPSILPNIASFYVPNNSSMTISEVSTSGFTTQISCTNANTGAVQNVSGNSITLNIVNAQTFSCVFTNQAIPPVLPCNPAQTKCGKLTIIKDTIPNDYQDFVFVHQTIPGYTQTFTLDDDASLPGASTMSNAATFYTPYNLNLLVAEVVNASYNVTITCNDPSGGTTVNGAIANISISQGEAVTCTFRNIPVTATACTPNTWTQKADFGGGDRYHAIGFSIGTKGYLGLGGAPGGIPVTDFWEYNPLLNVWTQKANFPGLTRSGAVSLSVSNKGYVGLGSGNSGYHLDFWEYNPLLNVWTQKANFPGVPRVYAAAFSIGGKGYVGTGHYVPTALQDFWEYNPATDTWTQKANFGGGPRYMASGFSVGNKGYLGTGVLPSTPSSTLSQDFWEYNPATDTWTQKANFGGGFRMQATGMNISNKGYLGMGSGIGFVYKQDFWEYNPATDTWTQKADFGGGVRSLAPGFNIGSKGYAGLSIVSGVGPYENDWWEYCP